MQRFTIRAALAALLIISIGSVAFAQQEGPATRPEGRDGRGGPGGGGGRPDPAALLERARQFLSDLKLSEEQQKKVDTILNQAAEDLKAMRDDLDAAGAAGAEPGERMQQVRQRMRKMRDEISGLLTEEQKQQFQQQFQQMRNRMGGAIERVQRAIQELNLTDEQQAKIEPIVAETRTKLQELRQQAEADGQQTRGKFREVIEDARVRINEILTPEQRGKFQEMTQPPPGGRGGPDDRGDRPRRRDRDGGGGGGGQEGNDRPPPPPPDNIAPQGARRGDPAPEFALTKLDGRPVQLSSFKGRVLILEFGSYSSPAFRDRAKGMEELKRDYNTRAQFLIIYTKEAHPVGEWEIERNKDEDIQVEQPREMNARRAIAKKAVEKLDITIPLAIDTMDDAVATAYAGFPNAAFVIARDGTIAALQKWADPSGLPRHIDAAMKSKDLITE